MWLEECMANTNEAPKTVSEIFPVILANRISIMLQLSGKYYERYMQPAKRTFESFFVTCRYDVLNIVLCYKIDCILISATEIRLSNNSIDLKRHNRWIFAHIVIIPSIFANIYCVFVIEMSNGKIAWGIREKQDSLSILQASKCWAVREMTSNHVIDLIKCMNKRKVSTLLKKILLTRHIRWTAKTMKRIRSVQCEWN